MTTTKPLRAITASSISALIIREGYAPGTARSRNIPGAFGVAVTVTVANRRTRTAIRRLLADRGLVFDASGMPDSFIASVPQPPAAR